MTAEGNVYYDQARNVYYWSGAPLCKNCKDQINSDVGFFIIRHPKTEKTYGALWCAGCLQYSQKNCPKVLYASEILSVHFDDIPPTAHLVPLSRMSLSSAAEVTVFSAAISNKGIKSDTSNVKVNDQTRLAGRESWEGASIGADVSDRIAQLDSVKVDGLAYLDGLKDAQLLIFGSEKKLLDVNKEVVREE